MHFVFQALFTYTSDKTVIYLNTQLSFYNILMAVNCLLCVDLLLRNCCANLIFCFFFSFSFFILLHSFSVEYRKEQSVFKEERL